jgi:L-lactate dehydrogenase complex protein LldG
MTESRTEILARVHQRQRQHLQQTEISEALSDIGHAPEVNLGGKDLVEAFLRRLDSQSATAAIVRDRSTAVRAISDYVYERYHHRRVVAGHDRKLASLPWRDGGVLARFDAASAEDSVSVSYAKVGIAETGSLGVYCDRSNPGSNNWLVMDHIVVLDVEDLVADYEQAWRHLREVQIRDGKPRGISLISGPSSTSDIKVEKVFGAHGPARLHLVLIGNLVALQSAVVED